jgi:hypothetical protein
VIVDQAILDQIDSRVRRRQLELPVQRGRLGELKRCPLRTGKETLTPRIPYDRYLDQASKHPHCARAVLALIDACLQPVKTQQITITSVERAGDTWLVRFVKGDHPELFDRDIYLARNNDFTLDASRQTVKGDPPLCAPFAEDLKRAREKALEKRVSPQITATRVAIQRTSELQRSMASMKARSLAKRAERTLRALEAALLSEGAVNCELLAATNGSPGEAERLPTASISATPKAA